jgi:DNA-binding XRE family transcriptional regulator
MCEGVGITSGTILAIENSKSFIKYRKNFNLHSDICTNVENRLDVRLFR